MQTSKTAKKLANLQRHFPEVFLTSLFFITTFKTVKCMMWYVHGIISNLILSNPINPQDVSVFVRLAVTDRQALQTDRQT